MESEITGIVQFASLEKNGITNGRAWTRYKVAINGINFSAFDKAYTDMVGKEVTARYTTNDRGYHTLKDLNSKPNPDQAILQKLDEMNLKLDTLLARG